MAKMQNTSKAHMTASPMFEPSPWLLQKMVDAAMTKADAAREHALITQEARRDAARKAIAAQAEG